MLLLSSVHMLPDVLHLLLGQGLQQIVLSALLHTVPDHILALIGRHHCTSQRAPLRSDLLHMLPRTEGLVHPWVQPVHATQLQTIPWQFLANITAHPKQPLSDLL